MTSEQELNYYKNPIASAVDRFPLNAPNNVDDNGTRTRDFIPGKNMVINNIGATRLKVVRNNAKGFKIIPASTIYEYNASSAEKDGFSHLTITNMSTTDAGEYFLEVNGSDTLKSLMYDLVKGLQK